jgi:hypothetical protein
MLSRREARRRLIARYTAALAELPEGKEPLFSLADLLTEQNIRATQELHLYPRTRRQPHPRAGLDPQAREGSASEESGNDLHHSIRSYLWKLI